MWLKSRLSRDEEDHHWAVKQSKSIRQITKWLRMAKSIFRYIWKRKDVLFSSATSKDHRWQLKIAELFPWLRKTTSQNLTKARIILKRFIAKVYNQEMPSQIQKIWIQTFYNKVQKTSYKQEQEIQIRLFQKTDERGFISWAHILSLGFAALFSR